MLYPKMTESRMVFDLNGVWDFCLMNGEAKGKLCLCRYLLLIMISTLAAILQIM